MVLHFMMSMSTILEEITRDMSKNATMGINWKFYQDRVKKIEPTYEGMIEDFFVNVFGEFSERASISHLELSLAQYSWKYFDQ